MNNYLEQGAGLGGYPSVNTYPQEKMVMAPTLKQRLSNAVRQAEEQLKVAQEAKEIFDRNPDLERLLDLMQKGRF